MVANLSPTRIIELNNLFNKKEWEIIVDKTSKESLFQRYCDRLKILDDNEQKLFIELSYEFQQIFLKDYIESFLMSFHMIDENLLKEKSTIIISPLINPYIEEKPQNIKKNNSKVERPKVKSSQFLYYMLAGHDLRWIDYSSKFEFCDTISEVEKAYKEGESLIILVDDFIGSGGTAITFCTDIIKEINLTKKVNSDDVCLVSIAAMREGKNKIKNDLGINTYSNIIKSKGITDSYEDEDVKLKIKMMLNMEAKIYFPIQCPENYRLGFKQSEALISFMNKTPNNTFPVFWYENKKRIAPFPRYKNYR